MDARQAKACRIQACVWEHLMFPDTDSAQYKMPGMLCTDMCRTHICSFAACAALQHTYADALFTEALLNVSWWGDHADSSRGFPDPQGGTQYFSSFLYPMLCQS